MKRQFYNRLLNWKSNTNKKPFMVLGARQVGKTYIIDEFCRNEFSQYLYVNLLERKDIVDLYAKNINSDEKYMKLKSFLSCDIEGENVVVFFDEIQESEHLIAELKYFCERHNNVNIVCAGSLLGVKLKRSRSSFPVGKVWIETMYPMNFEEFLVACGEESLIEEIRHSFNSNEPMLETIHHKAYEFFKKYLICGGMPEVVNSFIESGYDFTRFDKGIIESIVISYFNDMDKYVSNNAERIKIEKLYRSIPIQLNNQSKKFQYSKIEKDARTREYETSLDWLLSANMILQSFQVSLPEIPLKVYSKEDFFKVFLNDVGLLCYMSEINYVDILKDNVEIFKGPLTENYVACELINMGYGLYYWKNSATSEVDFVLYKDSKIIPIEVKGGSNVKSKSLDVYRATYNPEVSYRFSTKNFGYDEEKRIKSIPLYAVFCLRGESHE